MSNAALRSDDAVEIRRADASDHEALVAIRRSAILDLAIRTMSPRDAEKWANRAAPDRVVRAILEHAVWVALEGVPIGWVEVDKERIAALYVVPGWSCRGVGSRLLLRAEAAIRDAGYDTARLEASPNAADFYLHRGYCRSDSRTADGTWPLSKPLSERGPSTACEVRRRHGACR